MSSVQITDNDEKKEKKGEGIPNEHILFKIGFHRMILFTYPLFAEFGNRVFYQNALE